MWRFAILWIGGIGTVQYKTFSEQRFYNLWTMTIVYLWFLFASLFWYLKKIVNKKLHLISIWIKGIWPKIISGHKLNV